jgi:hypothetical protein
LISKSAFLFPNEADNCSCVKPSANADCFVVITIDAKIVVKIIILAIAITLKVEIGVVKSCWLDNHTSIQLFYNKMFVVQLSNLALYLSASQQMKVTK